MNPTRSKIEALSSKSSLVHGVHDGLLALRSVSSNHVYNVMSNKSEIRSINIDKAADDVDFLAEIGYKQELVRNYSGFQVFGIAFLIMGLLPSIATTLETGLLFLCVGATWGWFVSGLYVLSYFKKFRNMT